MDIRVDPLTDERVVALIQEHVADMAAASPPESCHALGLEALRHPHVTVWTAWDGTDLLGCGALHELDAVHGEVKSMRTVASQRRRGVAAAILAQMLEEARRRGYRRLSLETGAQAVFAPARALYAHFGFRVTGPFGAYRPDPNSVFMTLEL